MRALLRIPILVAPFALISSAMGAQTYGPDSQVLTIGAADFQPLHSGNGLLHSDGYLYYGGDDVFVAPLPLPEGALIERICLYANDSDPGGEVEAGFLAVKLVPGGEGPSQQLIAFNVNSEADVGYGYYCSGLFFHTLRARMNLDPDGVLDTAAYYVYAAVPAPTQNALGLGGVEITWARQLSPPPSSPTFGDVPTGDPAYQYIEALAASGITAGCADGNYCPDASLARRQMAVFLTKALGLHWTD